mmetsp:Transcript_7902/g.11280  ORF Transcript_7902/g.11280 Transcript_7902/m.11280 type:complete len:103 (+) Transcript_7902:321-629(+)
MCLPSFIRFQIRTDPRNPTPVGMAAETRAPSQCSGPLRKEYAEQIENKQAPKETRLIVLIAAGRSPDRLSNPISAPQAAANNILLPNVTSWGVRNNNSGARV